MDSRRALHGLWPSPAPDHDRRALVDDSRGRCLRGGAVAVWSVRHGSPDAILCGGIPPALDRALHRAMHPPVHPAVRIGHVHLKVANLERALTFWRDVLGFEVTQ